MKRNKLGQTDLKVSKLCLGTMNFGWKLNREKAFTIMDAFWEAGGNFFQAIATYPDSDLFPRPEDWLGKWLESRKIPREDIILSSRVILPSSLTLQGNDGLNRVKGWWDRSLKRLRSEYVDLLICEWSRSLLPIHASMQAFEELYSLGFFRHVGTANFPLWRTGQMQQISREHELVRLDAFQREFSLLSAPDYELNILDFLDVYELGFVATGCLAGGLLTNRPSSSPADRRKNAIIAKLHALAAEHDASSAEVALGWVLSNPAISSAIISVTSINQLEELIRAPSLQLPFDELSRLRGLDL